MHDFDTLIVGAGHGGAAAAIALRQLGYTGSLALLGEERDPPYERPPLSKDYLAGEKPFDRMLIRPLSFWTEREVTLLPGRRAVAVDAAGRKVTLAGGEQVTYGRMIWATGGAPRQLSCAGGDVAGVHAIRSRADVDLLASELGSASRVVVIGGGYVGLEAAAVLTRLGKQVTVVEAQDRVLSRVAGEPLARFYEAQHRAHGVDIRLGAKVDCIETRDGRACGVRLAGGEILAAEIIVVGIGITPAVAPLIAAGALGSDGVDVDEHCRTSLADIYAVGDCAAHVSRFAGGARVRIESVQNATDQAAAAARHISGQPAPYDAVPWFWSNQYDLRLQTVGLSTGHDRMIVRGDVASRSFSVVYMKQGRVIALDCVNATRDYVQGRKLVESGFAGDADALADTARPLKALMTAT